MIGLQITVQGLEGMEAALSEALEGLMPALFKGVTEGAEILRQEAQSLVPVATGELRDSIVVKGPREADGEVTAEVAATAGHALYVEMGTAKAGGRARPYMYPAYQAKEKAARGAILGAVQRAVGGK